MTLDEAKQELADPTGNSPHKVVEAARVLLDALRAAESQVANLSSQTTYDVRCPKCSSSMVRDTAQSGGAEAIRLRRESSGRVVMVEPYEPPDTAWLREWISRKPTKERDIYEKPIVDLCDAVDALLAMGATAPVPPARTSEPAAPTPGPTARCYLCGSNECIGFLHTTNGRNDYCAAHDPSAPKPGPTTPGVNFDAEAALLTMRVRCTALPRETPMTALDARDLIDAGLAAGRRGTR